MKEIYSFRNIYKTTEEVDTITILVHELPGGPLSILTEKVFELPDGEIVSVETKNVAIPSDAIESLRKYLNDR